MSQVILVIHLFLALAIIALVLLQRSEGGGLGLGGGGGGLGGFATPQGTANVLTRATAICAAGFFVTSLTLGVLASNSTAGRSFADRLDSLPAAAATTEAGADAVSADAPADTPTPPVEGGEAAPAAPAQAPAAPVSE